MVRRVQNVKVPVIGLSQTYYMNLSELRRKVRKMNPRDVKRDVPGFGVNRSISPGHPPKFFTMNTDVGGVQGHPVDPHTSIHGTGYAPPRSARHRQYFRVGIGGAP
jgi:hypothetical protein